MYFANTSLCDNANDYYYQFQQEQCHRYQLVGSTVKAMKSGSQSVYEMLIRHGMTWKIVAEWNTRETPCGINCLLCALILVRQMVIMIS